MSFGMVRYLSLTIVSSDLKLEVLLLNEYIFFVSVTIIDSDVQYGNFLNFLGLEHGRAEICHAAFLKLLGLLLKKRMINFYQCGRGDRVKAGRVEQMGQELALSAFS
jgi:hypothetical protein